MGAGQCLSDEGDGSRALAPATVLDVLEGRVGVPDQPINPYQAVKQHEVLIGDHSHDLVYDLREEEDEAQFRDLSPQGEYEQARRTPGLICSFQNRLAGPWTELH